MCDCSSNQNVSTYKERCKNRKQLQLAPFPPIACNGEVPFHVGPSIRGLFAVFYQYVLVVCGQHSHFHLLGHSVNANALECGRQVFKRRLCITSRLSPMRKFFGQSASPLFADQSCTFASRTNAQLFLKMEWRAPFIRPSYRG